MLVGSTSGFGESVGEAWVWGQAEPVRCAIARRLRVSILIVLMAARAGIGDSPKVPTGLADERHPLPVHGVERHP
jgi:hypothetical protein